MYIFVGVQNKSVPLQSSVNLGTEPQSIYPLSLPQPIQCLYPCLYPSTTTIALIITHYSTNITSHCRNLIRATFKTGHWGRLIRLIKSVSLITRDDQRLNT